MQLSSFRPIYYLGCKNEFVRDIAAAIEDVDPGRGRLGDLFAGTGAVAAALSSTREVLTADVQEYSRVLCSAVLRPYRGTTKDIHEVVERARDCETARTLTWCFEPLIVHEQDCIVTAEKGSTAKLVALLESRPIATWTDEWTGSDEYGEAAAEVVRRLKSSGLWGHQDSTVARMFGGIYFSFAQSVALDALLCEANKSIENKDNFLAATLSSASNLVNTVGKQFAQPLRPKAKDGAVKAGLVKVVRRDRTMDPFAAFKLWLHKYSTLPIRDGAPITLRQDFHGALREHSSRLSVLYADPPYTRDHYSRFYHVLETMCLRDDPAFAKVKKQGRVEISRGLYREDRFQSDFCIRSLAPKAFSSLFEAASESGLPLVLSYSPHETGDGTHPRVVSTAQIMALANEFYRRVELVTINGSTHNNLNRSGLKLKERDHAEILVKCYQ